MHSNRVNIFISYTQHCERQRRTHAVVLYIGDTFGSSNLDSKADFPHPTGSQTASLLLLLCPDEISGSCSIPFVLPWILFLSRNTMWQNTKSLFSHKYCYWP